MPKFFDWYITEHQIDMNDTQKLDNSEYLGNCDFIYIGHGNVTDSPKFLNGERIHTSAIKSLEFLEDKELLRIYTQNSIYDCALQDCSFNRQEQLALLPFSLKDYAEKYKFGNYGVPKHNSIILVFADYKGYSLLSALLDLNGKIFQLGYDIHSGMLQDSCLIHFKDSPNYKTKKTLKNIDIRFFLPVNIFSNLIQFYRFESAKFPIYLHNAGKSEMIFKTEKWRIELKPNERKLVSTENFTDF